MLVVLAEARFDPAQTGRLNARLNTIAEKLEQLGNVLGADDENAGDSVLLTASSMLAVVFSSATLGAILSCGHRVAEALSDTKVRHWPRSRAAFQ